MKKYVLIIIFLIILASGCIIQSINKEEFIQAANQTEVVKEFLKEYPDTEIWVFDDYVDRIEVEVRYEASNPKPNVDSIVLTVGLDRDTKEILSTYLDCEYSKPGSFWITTESTQDALEYLKTRKCPPIN